MSTTGVVREIHVSLDADTFARLRPPARKPDVADSVARIAQVISVAAAGLWTLYLYFSYDAANHELSLRLASLQETQARLANQIAAMDRDQRRIALARAQQTPVSVTHDVTAIDLGSAPGKRRRYLITYNYVITNNSEHVIDVDNVLVNAYHARTNDCADVEVNEFSASKPVVWRRVLQRAHILKNWTEGAALRDGDERVLARNGSGGTGRARSGETLRGGVDMILIAEASDLVGFRLQLAVGGAGAVDPRDLRAIRTIKAIQAKET